MEEADDIFKYAEEHGTPVTIDNEKENMKIELKELIERKKMICKRINKIRKAIK